MQTDLDGSQYLDENLYLELAKINYPDLWSRITADWIACNSDNFAWLSYSANYLISSGGVHWAVDPFSMSDRIPGIIEPDYVTSLECLELVVLTHNHNDHLDLQLISKISSLPIKWIIPDHLLDHVLSNTTLTLDKVVLPINGDAIHYKSLKITPFQSLHFHGNSGVPETGYLAEFGGKRWAFPGDIRNYQVNQLPRLENLTGCFAHLWLGKAKAKHINPPLLNEFCNFHVNLNPKKIIVTHLYEFGRDEYDLWNDSHYKMVENKFNEIATEIDVEKAVMGDRVEL